MRASSVCRRSAGMVCALLLAGTSLTGCDRWSGSGAAVSGPAPASTHPSGYGSVFLGRGECSSFGTTSFTEVSCNSERAAARVIARYDGSVADGPSCPATTDFLLHISGPSSAEGGDAVVPPGYACMRKLEPPHPGDPGGGGGPRTIVGDCVYGSGRGQVRETACDGTGAERPQYRVTSAVTARSQCPTATELYVDLGGTRPVGCARPV
ncbi:hypothetical protein [Streptomyces sp. NBC_00728]|uniref:hypothetical protein n=1 Tax=Streptomyces sp. NBC_00728 TaxID=2903676 RepID=UPI003869CCD8